jgi:hypothetical protein
MFTGTPQELRARERKAREIATQVAALLNQVADLGLGPAMGNLIIPGVDIRSAGGKWTAK